MKAPRSNNFSADITSNFTFPPDPSTMPSSSRLLDHNPPPYAEFFFAPPPPPLSSRNRYSTSPKLFPTTTLAELEQTQPPSPEYLPADAPWEPPRERRGSGRSAKEFFRSITPQSRRRVESRSRRGSMGRDPLSITSIAFDPTVLEAQGAPPTSRRVRTQSSFNLLRFAKGLQPHRSSGSTDSQTSSKSSSSVQSSSHRAARRTRSAAVLRPSTPEVTRPKMPRAPQSTPLPNLSISTGRPSPRASFATLRHSPSTPSMFNPISQSRERLRSVGARLSGSQGSRSIIYSPHPRPTLPIAWLDDHLTASPSASVESLNIVHSADPLDAGDDPFAHRLSQSIPFPRSPPVSPSQSTFLAPSDAETLHFDAFAPRSMTPNQSRKSSETLRVPERHRYHSGASLRSVWSGDSEGSAESFRGRRTRRGSVLSVVDTLVRISRKKRSDDEGDGGSKGGKWW
ncbi:hypothetical protein P7C70_g6913, partial [Phenoliferia sp. Uapishka_3]